MRFKVSEIAPAVDRVLGEQLVGLAKALGGTLPDDDKAAADEPAKRDSNLDDAMADLIRSEEHTSELQSLMRISYAVFCLKQKKLNQLSTTHTPKLLTSTYNLHSNTLQSPST